MNNQTPSLSSCGIATFHDNLRAEVFAADLEGENRELVTIQFYEQRPDLAEIERLKKVNWKVKVPPGAKPWLTAAGHRRDALKMFWVGWRDSTTFNALSLYQGKPITVQLPAGDRLLAQPVTLANKMLHQYFIRPAGPAWQIWRHQFSGELNQPGLVESKKLLDLRIEPVLAAAIPIAEQTSGDVVLGWIEGNNLGLRLGAARVKDETAKQIISEPISELKPSEGARLGLYVGSSGKLHASFMAQTLDRKAYYIIQAVVDFTEGKCIIRKEGLNLPEDSVHSCASFYLKHPDEPMNFICVLLKNGDLLLNESGKLRMLRHGVAMDFDFPIVTTLGGRYEAVRNENGEIEMKTIE